MNNKPAIYATVLKKVLEKTSSVSRKNTIARFVRLLKRRGDLKIGGKIMQEFKRAWEERKGGKALVVTALPFSQKQKKQTAAALKRRGFVYQEKIDPALIGGAMIFLGNEYMIDNSLKGKLKKLLK